MSRHWMTVVALLVFVARSDAWENCCRLGPPPPLRTQMAEADFIVYGRLENPQGSDENGGTTDLVILRVVKDHPFLKDQKVLPIPKYIPVARDKPTQMLVAAALFMGKPDYYLGVPGG